MGNSSGSSNRTLWIATSNQGKLADFRLAFELWFGQRSSAEHAKQGAWSAETLPDISSLPECVEDGTTFSANARKKALHYSRFTDGIVLGDDSGLAVDALGGDPGVRSRRFAGDSATDQENNLKLLSALDKVPDPDRTARFICVLALAQRGKLIHEFQGTADGMILRAPRGSEGFGYDPLFFDSASGKSFADLSRDEKLRRSHRGQAIIAMIEWLAGNCSTNKGR